MKLWATFLAAGLLAGSTFANSTTQDGNGSKWTINVGLAIPEGDLKDAGVDNMFSVGADWMLGYGGMNSMGSNTQQYVGIGFMFGDGDFDLDVMTYGIHYGILFGFAGDQGDGNWEWGARLQGGYYNTKLEAGSFEADEWGFGGSAGITYRPRNSNGFNVNFGYYFMPEVEGVDNRGWNISVSIPVR